MSLLIMSQGSYSNIDGTLVLSIPQDQMLPSPTGGAEKGRARVAMWSRILLSCTAYTILFGLSDVTSAWTEQVLLSLLLIHFTVTDWVGFIRFRRYGASGVPAELILAGQKPIAVLAHIKWTSKKGFQLDLPLILTAVLVYFIDWDIAWQGAAVFLLLFLALAALERRFKPRKFLFPAEDLIFLDQWPLALLYWISRFLGAFSFYCWVLISMRIGFMVFLLCAFVFYVLLRRRKRELGRTVEEFERHAEEVILRNRASS